MIDLNRRIVTIRGQIIRPSRQGFDICAYLAAHPGFIRSRVQIMDAVGIDLETCDTCICDHAKRLRAIGVTAIRTAQGVGYFWEE